MISLVFLSLTLTLSFQSVSAHGWLNDVVIGGTQTIVGNVPNASPTATVIRQINDVSSAVEAVDPVKGSNNTFLSCGQNSQVASDVAMVNPGDTVQFKWVNGLQGPWVHNVGPMQTYMTSCGSDSCNSTSFDATSASWFKIQEQGRVPGTTDNTWFMSLMNSGAPANVTIPSNIAPGNYLIRHELIALQIAQTEGGAEFYPACVQVVIGGNGTGSPMENETVMFPGAYSDTDPGILIDVYDGNDTYIFPGPPVAAFVASPTSNDTDTSSGNTATGSASTSTDDSTSSSHSTSTTNGSSGSCSMKKRQVNDAQNARDSSRVRPRHPISKPRPRNLSRVMKGLVSQ